MRFPCICAHNSARHLSDVIPPPPPVTKQVLQGKTKRLIENWYISCTVRIVSALPNHQSWSEQWNVMKHTETQQENAPDQLATLKRSNLWCWGFYSCPGRNWSCLDKKRCGKGVHGVPWQCLHFASSQERTARGYGPSPGGRDRWSAASSTKGAGVRGLDWAQAIETS